MTYLMQNTKDSLSFLSLENLKNKKRTLLIFISIAVSVSAYFSIQYSIKLKSQLINAQYESNTFINTADTIETLHSAFLSMIISISGFAVVLTLSLIAVQLAIVLVLKHLAGKLFINENRSKPESLPIPQKPTLDTQPLCDPAQLESYHENIEFGQNGRIQSLSADNKTLKEILDNAQIIIMTIHKNGTIASINQYGAIATGYKKHELVGSNFVDLNPSNQQLALNDLEIMSSVANGELQSHKHESCLRHKNGDESTILWLHSQLQNQSDAPLLSAGINITSQKKLENNLRWMAEHDSLTSLYNRQRFDKELSNGINWAKRHKGEGALFNIDINNFKDINNRFGHATGDNLLSKVAESITNTISELDLSTHPVAARLGNDQFAILLRDFDLENSEILCNRLLDTLPQLQIDGMNNSNNVSLNIGVSLFPLLDSNSNTLLSNADHAMQQSKQRGCNQYQVYNEDNKHHLLSDERIEWCNKIIHALKNDLFILHYQPILDIEKGSISHYETLIRMKDGKGGLLLPSQFIPIAEQNGLIQQIDSLIVNSAIAKQAELAQKGYNITLTINLSSKVFDSADLYTNIKNAIDTHGAQPENLIFEITETGEVSDIEKAEKIMSAIQQLGCHFALDDFGVGFSSFNYLRELPVDFVKIDGSFINDLDNNIDNEVLVKALSQVAIGFNKFTVAEFVDSQKTLNILKEAKIKYAQGYFIGKPSDVIPVATPTFIYEKLPQHRSMLHH